MVETTGAVLVETNEDYVEYKLNEVIINVCGNTLDVTFNTMILYVETVARDTDFELLNNRLQRVLRCCEELRSIYTECGQLPPEAEY